jgi:hypothetical protein
VPGFFSGRFRMNCEKRLDDDKGNHMMFFCNTLNNFKWNLDTLVVTARKLNFLPVKCRFQETGADVKMVTGELCLCESIWTSPMLGKECIILQGKDPPFHSVPPCPCTLLQIWSNTLLWQFISMTHLKRGNKD